VTTAVVGGWLREPRVSERITLGMHAGERARKLHFKRNTCREHSFVSPNIAIAIEDRRVKIAALANNK
jgi:hypothetical protein